MGIGFLGGESPFARFWSFRAETHQDVCQDGEALAGGFC